MSIEKTGTALTDLPTGVAVGAKPAKKPETTHERVTIEKVKAVIERIEKGQSERSACRDENVSRSSFRISALRAGAGDQYAQALEMLAADQVEQIEKTIEDMRNGTIDAQMARVELDARKWFASKFLPKRYGDKIDHTTNGKDLPTPILGNIPAQNTNNDVIDLT